MMSHPDVLLQGLTGNAAPEQHGNLVTAVDRHQSPPPAGGCLAGVLSRMFKPSKVKPLMNPARIDGFGIPRGDARVAPATGTTTTYPYDLIPYAVVSPPTQEPTSPGGGPPPRGSSSTANPVETDAQPLPPYVATSACDARGGGDGGVCGATSGSVSSPSLVDVLPSDAIGPGRRGSEARDEVERQLRKLLPRKSSSKLDFYGKEVTVSDKGLAVSDGGLSAEEAASVRSVLSRQQSRKGPLSNSHIAPDREAGNAVVPVDDGDGVNDDASGGPSAGERVRRAAVVAVAVGRMTRASSSRRLLDNTPSPYSRSSSRASSKMENKSAIRPSSTARRSSAASSVAGVSFSLEAKQSHDGRDASSGVGATPGLSSSSSSSRRLSRQNTDDTDKAGSPSPPEKPDATVPFEPSSGTNSTAALAPGDDVLLLDSAEAGNAVEHGVQSDVPVSFRLEAHRSQEGLEATETTPRLPSCSEIQNTDDNKDDNSGAASPKSCSGKTVRQVPLELSSSNTGIASTAPLAPGDDVLILDCPEVENNAAEHGVQSDVPASGSLEAHRSQERLDALETTPKLSSCCAHNQQTNEYSHDAASPTPPNDSVTTIPFNDSAPGDDVLILDSQEEDNAVEHGAVTDAPGSGMLPPSPQELVVQPSRTRSGDGDVIRNQGNTCHSPARTEGQQPTAVGGGGTVAEEVSQQVTVGSGGSQSGKGIQGIQQSNGSEAVQLIEISHKDDLWEASPSGREGEDATAAPVQTHKQQASGETTEASGGEVDQLLREIIGMDPIVPSPPGAVPSRTDPEFRGEMKVAPPSCDGKQPRNGKRLAGLTIVTEDNARQAPPDMLGTDAITRLLRGEYGSRHCRHQQAESDRAVDTAPKPEEGLLDILESYRSPQPLAKQQDVVSSPLRPSSGITRRESALDYAGPPADALPLVKTLLMPHERPTASLQPAAEVSQHPPQTDERGSSSRLQKHDTGSDISTEFNSTKWMERLLTGPVPARNTADAKSPLTGGKALYNPMRNSQAKTLPGLIPSPPTSHLPSPNKGSSPPVSLT